MEDKKKKKEELIQELDELRQQIVRLEKVKTKLKPAAKEFQAIIHAAMDGFWVTDMQGNFLDVNDAYCCLIGYSRDELLKMRISDVEAEEKPQETAQRIQKIRETGGDRFETRHRRKDGRIIDIEVSVNYLKKIDQMFVFLRDITERKQIEKALGESEERYKKVIESAAEIIHTTDVMGKFTFANSAALKAAGTTIEEFIQLNFLEIIHPDHRQRLLEIYTNQFRERKPTIYAEFPILSRSGEVKWLGQNSSLMFEGKKVVGFHSVARDITDRKRAEEEAKRLAQENAIMADIGRIISSTLNIEEVYERFAAETRKLIRGDRITIAIGNLEDNSLKVAYAWGHEMADRKVGDFIALAGTTSERVMRTRIGMLIQKENQEEVINEFPEALPYFKAGFRSMMVVPLISKDRAIGVLHCRSFNPNAYTERDFRLAERVGNQIAGAIHNSQLFADHRRVEEALQKSEEEAKRLAQENAAVAEIGRIISSTLDIEGVYERFAEEVHKLVPCDRAAFTIINPEDRTAATVYASGIKIVSRRPGEVFPLAGSATEMAVQAKTGLIIKTEDENEVASRVPGLLPVFRAGIRSVIMIPLISRDRVTGVLNLQSIKPNAYTEKDLRIAERVGSQIAGAIANAQLYIERIQAEEAARRSEEEAKHLAQENAVMAEIGRIVSSTLEIEEVYGRFAEEVRKIISFDGIIVGVINYGDNTVDFRYSAGIDIPSRRGGDVMPLTAGTASAEVMRTRLSLLVQGKSPAEVTNQFPGLLPYIQVGVQSFLLVPLFSRDQVMGVLGFSSKKPDAYSRKDVSLAERVGNQIAGAIANAGLFAEHQKVELINHEQLSFLQVLIDTIPSPIFYKDREGKYLGCNKAWEQMNGMKRYQMVGKTVFEIAPPESATIYKSQDEELLSRGGVQIYDGKVTSVEGIKHDVVFNKATFTKADGTIGGLVGMILDITERKQAEEALRKSEEESKRLAQENAVMAEIGRIVGSTLKIEEAYEGFAQEMHKIIDFDRVAVNVIDPEKGTFDIPYVAGSQVIDRWVGDVIPLAGTATEEVFRTGSSLLIQEENREEFTNRYPGLLPIFKAGFNSVMMTPLISQNKVIGALNVQSNKANVYTEKELRITGRVSAQIAGAIANAQLFAERQRSEEALRESEERYRTILANIEDGYYEVDIEGNFTFFNDSLCRMLGYSEDEMIGMNNRQYTDQENAKKLFQTFNHVYRTEQPARDSGWEIITKDGTKKYNEASVSLIRDLSGNKIGFRGIVRDITERKKAEKEMAELQEQLRQSQKIEAIGQLAGGIAHDFNNALTLIRVCSQLALMELKEQDPLREKFEMIEKATEQSANLTRQLLAFSRRQIMEMKVIDLNSLIREMDKMLHRVIGEDIDLVSILAEDLGRVKVDPGQMEQVIVNFALNARDAMPRGGKLTIETANVDLDEKYVNNHVGVKRGRYVRVSVSDTGMGMTAEVKAKVFEPFFTTKEKGKGTGLGLSTVYGIVKQSGGNVWVYSEPARGATFKVYLPRVDEPLEEEKARLMQMELPRGAERILVVEDQEDVRNLVTQILKKQGYEVFEAANGGEAFLIFEKNEGAIDMLVTDVVMPVMSGRELAERLLVLHPRMKVLYMSGYTDDAIVRHGVLEEGLNFIEKPFSLEALVKKVREVLDK